MRQSPASLRGHDRPGRFAWSLLLLLSAVRLAAAEDSLARVARTSMENATAFIRSIATEGGYLWRYSPDLKERAGEGVATSTQISVQPPGTPAMGLVFLHVYGATGDARYLEAARDAAHALAVGQLESGGWDYVIDFDPRQSPRWYRRSDVGRVSAADAAKRRNTSTYDDDVTQSAIRLLVAVADATRESADPRDVRIREARDYALLKLLASQRPSGGWPQRWAGQPVDPAHYPVQRARFPRDYPRQHPAQDYTGYYTLNDDTQRDCVVTLLDAARRLDRADLRAAAVKGADFLLLAQLPEPQPVWAQQYNPQLEPAWARAFEPPSVAGGESVGAVRLLLDFYVETGERKYLDAVQRAIAWYRRSEVAPGLWARIYEIGSNQPIYGDRDGTIKHRFADVSPERQVGYTWTGGFGMPEVMAYYHEVAAQGREAYLARRSRATAASQTETGRAAIARELAPRVREIIAALDAQHRWLGSGGRKTVGLHVTMELFITHMRTLADYVAAAR